MIKINLVGNPNTGKTTLFNTLSHSHEHVGNWHGVTVEEKSVTYKYKDQYISVTDLPGIYSLTALSFEEKVATDYIYSHKDGIFINICDASNMQRNMYLTLSLMELGVPIIMVVNQIDKRKICNIDFQGLSEALNVKIVYLNANDKKSLALLSEAIIQYHNQLLNQNKASYNLGYKKTIITQYRELIKEYDGIIKEKVKNNDVLTEYYQIKILEDDQYIKEDFAISKNFNCSEKIASARYDYIDQLMNRFSSKRERVYGQSKLDKIFLNKFLALPMFLLLIFISFYLTFFSVGAFLSDLVGFLLEKLISNPLLSLLVDNFGVNSWIVSLFENAIIGGVGSILTFLPQVALLFCFLSILEDSGYLSRVAFVFEDILSKVGLSGKSVYTLLMGFGCSTTAVLTARNMEDKNSKIKTALLTPYMSCSAKFPIYTVLGGAFFGVNNIFVICGLYLLGVVIAVALSYVLDKTLLKSKTQSFILEFPPYRNISFKRTLSVLWLNIKMFVVRVTSLILAMNIVIWFMSNFTITFKYVGNGGVSVLETVGRLLAPIFTPLGFGSWGIVSALITGLVAKEIILSSIAMLNGVQDSSLNAIQSSVFLATSAVYFASSSAVLSFLVFCLLYFPCVSTFSVLIKEIGTKWTLLGVLIEFLIAYFTAFVVYSIGGSIGMLGVFKVLITILGIFMLLISTIFVYKRIKNNRLCPYDKKCRKCKRK